MARLNKYRDLQCVLDRKDHYINSKLANQSNLYWNSTSWDHVLCIYDRMGGRDIDNVFWIFDFQFKVQRKRRCDNNVIIYMKVSSYMNTRHFICLQWGKMPRKIYKRERDNKREKRATETCRKGSFSEIEIWKVGKVLQTDWLCEYLGWHNDPWNFSECIQSRSSSFIR